MASDRKNLAFLAGSPKLREVRVIVTEGWNDAEAAGDVPQHLARRSRANAHIRLMKFRHFGVRGQWRTPLLQAMSVCGGLNFAARNLGFGGVVVLQSYHGGCTVRDTSRGRREWYHDGA